MFEIEFLRVHNTTSTNSPEENADGSVEHSNNSKGNLSRPVSPYQIRRDSQQGLRNILLKGQMRYIDDIDAIIFLCSPL